MSSWIVLTWMPRVDRPEGVSEAWQRLPDVDAQDDQRAAEIAAGRAGVVGKLMVIRRDCATVHDLKREERYIATEITEVAAG